MSNPISPIPLQRGGNQTFGRRLGRPLSPLRKSALAHLEQLGIAPDRLGAPATLDPRTLFPQPLQKIWFEIGFGAGEHLLARMHAAPHDGFIGAEPYINGMSAMLTAFGPQTPLPGNLRLYMNDALHIIKALQPGSLDGLYILNPDPWPKKKHHKRRIVTADNLAIFARVIKPGGQLILATDVQEYANWMVEHLNMVPHLFTASAATARDPHTPPTDWPLVTRYMDKGVKAGRNPNYLVYTRVN